MREILKEKQKKASLTKYKKIRQKRKDTKKKRKKNPPKKKNQKPKKNKGIQKKKIWLDDEPESLRERHTFC